MKTFLYKIAVFAILVFVLDKGFLLWEASLPALEYDQRLEQLIKKEIKQEVLILGSSRGARDILADELEEQTGYTTYNLSYPGSDIFFHKFLFKKCIEKANPKLVVLTLDDPGTFYDYKTINFRYDKLYPLTAYPEIRDVLVEQGKKTPYVVDWMVAYRIRESFPSSLSPKEASVNETLGTHGSMPLGFKKAEFNGKYSGKPMVYDIKKENKEKVVALKEMLQMAKSAGIPLLLVYPPNFYPPTKDYRARIQHLVGEDAMVYAYQDSNVIYQNADYFYDETHLQTKGAKVFTAELALAIKGAL